MAPTTTTDQQPQQQPQKGGGGEEAPDVDMEVEEDEGADDGFIKFYDSGDGALSLWLGMVVQ
jgi:hypothetical protein